MGSWDYAAQSGYAVFYDHIYEVEPADFSTDLSRDSRPGSVSGDYGIVRDNGTISHSWHGAIIREDATNESGGILYNPALNQSIPFSDWSYDYASKTYTLTAANGTISVSYGDYFMTIEQGGKTYKFAYVIL